MKIFAAAVQVQQLVDTFLHAGYGSAFPRTLITYGRGWSRGLPFHGQPRMKLELTEALRLKGETVASALTQGQTDGVAGPAAGLLDAAPGPAAGLLDAAPGPAAGLLDSVPGQLLLVVTAFFAGLALFYLLRAHRHRLALLRHRLALLRPRAVGASLTLLHPRAVAASLALLAAPLLLGAADPGPGAANPGTAGPRYQDPALATRALMQTIIADALANSGKVRKGFQYARLRLGSLEPIRSEVALPTRQLTAGMKYALEHYDRDGWGRPFRVRGSSGYGFRVRSAGPDGTFGTRDDLRTRVHLDHIYEWESRRRAYFLRQVNGELVLLFHRSKMRTFRFNDQERARALTGTELFDAIPVSKLSRKDRRRMQRLYKAVAGDNSQALVALAFRARRY